MTSQYNGKANKRRLLRMGSTMMQQLRLCHELQIPEWAGVAWAISPYYNPQLDRVARAMGPEWMARAQRVAKALAIAAS